jgi:hypothetical protein
MSDESKKHRKSHAGVAALREVSKYRFKDKSASPLVRKKDVNDLIRVALKSCSSPTQFRLAAESRAIVRAVLDKYLAINVEAAAHVMRSMRMVTMTADLLQTAPHLRRVLRGESVVLSSLDIAAPKHRRDTVRRLKYKEAKAAKVAAVGGGDD